MLWTRRFRLRLRTLFRNSAVENDLDRELAFHVDRATDENIARGMDPQQARLAALRRFGNPGLVGEECRDERRTAVLENFVLDLRFALRTLRKSAGFAATAILTVALGAGATTAIFSIVYGVLLKPLPYGEPGRLVSLWATAEKAGHPKTFVAAADHRDWRAQNHVFEDIALVRHIANFNLTGEGEPERLFGARISANLLSVLRVNPLLGRAFTEDEDEIGRERVAILSYDLWRRRFGGDRSAAGKIIQLNGTPYTIVGVMDESFRYPTSEFDLWTPLTINPADFKLRLPHSFLSVARLKRGVSLEQAQAEMNVIAARLARQYPASNADTGVLVSPMQADAVRPVRDALYVALGAVGSVLLIGCANLANLLLVRALGRRRELTVRAALGASRARLAQQAVTELLPVLAIGGALGLLFAASALRLFVPFLPATMPRVEEIGISAAVVIFSLCLLAVSGLAVAAWPALQIARGDLVSNLKEGVRTTSSRRQLRLRNALVVAQLALATTLLISAGLLIRSFLGLRAVDPGFRTGRVLSAHIAIPRSRYGSDLEVARFCHRILERVRAIPGVERVGMINRLPLVGGIQTGPLEFSGRQDRQASLGELDWRTVTPDYFRVMGIRLLRGRSFTDEDTEDRKAVAILDERLAQTVWPGEDPIGKRLRIPFAGMPWCEVVGVVARVRHGSLERDSRPQVYWNYWQRAMDRMALVVETRGDPALAGAPVIAAIRSIDPDQPVYDVRTMDQVLDRSIAQRWLNAALLGAFAGAALLLAAVGVYGVISYSAGQRAREFGVRIALGATGSRVAGSVVGQGALLALAGAVIGLTAALALTRVLESLLFGVGVRDWLSFSAGAALLGIVALAASYLPARRAARIDPVRSLRCE